jgi:phosphopantothenoylcysteine decarboxylase / phosphopantothenate---cysteine ligase
MALDGRDVILGVGGGISAYKSAELLRRLQDIGLVVTVVPTSSSLNFVGKATWEALSGKEVPTDLWSKVSEVPHISLAKMASAIIIAPTTADLLAKLVQGVCDDLLTNIFMSSRSPKILVPAMHPEMWGNPATVENVKKLRDRGILVIEPDEGRMTGSDVGIGRYPEISRLINEISSFLEINSDLQGKKLLITAGGTRENIDPVRFIGNNSSGKQGLAIAIEGLHRGAQVKLIGANLNLEIPKGIDLIKVSTTAELDQALEREFENCDLLVMAAAVADAKPISTSSKKIKKDDLKNIELEKNSDLLAKLSGRKRSNQVIIGFSAETNDLHQSEANRKLTSKNLDFIYANDVSDGQIFGSDETSGWILSKEGHKEEFLPASKTALAHRLLDMAKDKLSYPNE